jgi:hypothetical protein
MKNSPSASHPATFAERLRDSFEQMRSEVGSTLPGDLAPTEAAIANLTWDEIAHAHRHSFNGVDIDGRYAGVVRSFQRGSRQIWGPLLLEMLAPALAQRADAFFSMSSAVSQDDIEQQLVLEVLRDAARIDLRPDRQFVDQRLVREPCLRVRRWLRQMHRQSDESLELHPDLGARERRDDLAALEDLCGGGVRKDDVELIYRFHVRRDSLRQLASEFGLHEEAMLTRIRRARQRLRDQLRNERAPDRDEAA